MPSLNSPDALETLLGAGNLQEAFAQILLGKLSRLEEGQDRLEGKLDEHNAKHAAKLAELEAQLADQNRRITAMEDGRKSLSEQLWKAAGLIIAVLGVAWTALKDLHTHH